MKRKESNIKLIHFLFLIILVIGTIFYTFSLNKNDTLCKNKKIFLGIKDTLKIIELESYNQLKEEILSEISIKLNKETCCDENEFLLKLENGRKVNLFLSNNCKKCGRFFHHNWFSNKILINSDNQILVNEIICELDSVPERICEILINKEDKFSENISIVWDLNTDKEQIEKVISKTQDGYLLCYSQLAKKEFKKEICDLNEYELLQIHTLKFSKFYLGFGNKVYKPSIPINIK